MRCALTSETAAWTACSSSSLGTAPSSEGLAGSASRTAAAAAAGAGTSGGGPSCAPRSLKIAS